jgi:DNA-binding IclR family transcriptional regulator
MTKPKNLDLKGLAVKLCELLGAQSGDTIALHVLQDGSVRVIDYSTASHKLEIMRPAS